MTGTGNSGLKVWIGRMSSVTLSGLMAALLAGCGESQAPASSAPQATASEAGALEPTPAAPGRSPHNNKQTVTVTEGTNLSFALSPDQKTLVVSLQGVLFSMPATGGTASPLTGYYHDAREPAWTPDGSQIVFQGYRNGTWDLWALPVDGGDPRTLTDDPFDDREPQVSPTGEQVAFASDRSGNYDIWLLNLSDGQMAQVTDGPEDEFSPTWSPDGSQIAYAVTTGRSSSELRRKELSTGASATIIAEQGSISGVRWQPDSRGLTYQLGTPGKTALKQVATAGGQNSTLSEPGDDVFPFRADWLDDQIMIYAANGVINRRTPAGTRTIIGFEADFELDRPPYERQRRNHDDASPRRALGLSQPAISPDGQQITFTALGDLWLWIPDQDQLTNLTDSPFAERSPEFSPDGNRIAYVSDQPEGSHNGTALWIYDITQKQHSRVPLAASGIASPAWSPDGKSVAVFSAIAGSPLASQMSIANLEDGSLTPVHTPVPAQGISWSQDGEFVATTELAPYSSRYREGVYQLTITSRTTGETYAVQPVPHKNITDVSLTPFGQAMSYIQDGQLWQQRLSEQFEPNGYPEPLTAQLTDTPSWSTGSPYLVFMSGDKMLRLNVDTGAAEDITPRINWEPAILNATWSILIGRLFDGTGDSYQENVLLTIEGNRIKSIEPATPEMTPGIDASHLAAFPGLFEMHAHMGDMSESQGRAWLAWGITSVRDPGSHPYVAKERQETWDSGRIPGPRTHITGYLADGNRVYYSVAEGIGSDVHLDRALERVEKLQLDFIKTYVRLPDHRQKRVLDFAHELGIPVSSHELFPAVAHGMDHVEHIGGTSRRGYMPKVSALGRSYDDVIQLLVASNMGITPTAVLPGYSVIAANEPNLFDTPQFEHFYGEAGRQSAAVVARMFGAGAAEMAVNNGKLIKALVAEDALLVTGTDSPFVPYGAGLHAELRLFARAGLSPAEILIAATAKSAKAAGVEHDIGTLKPGMIADLVLVDGDPLADIADADNVTLTIKNGRGYPLETLLESTPAP